MKHPGAVAALATAVGLYAGAIGAVRASQPDPAPAMSTMAAASGGTVDLHELRPAVAALYSHAAEHEDTYRQVPCYCGCDSFDDHANLLDCFVLPDGSGYEIHGAGCAICQAEAEQVRQLMAQGESSRQIRAAIVEQFGPSNNPART